MIVVAKMFVFCSFSVSYIVIVTVNLCQCMEKRLKKVSGELFVGKSCFHRLRTQKALLIKVSKSISRTLAVFLSILLKKVSKYFQYFGTFSLKDRNTFVHVIHFMSHDIMSMIFKLVLPGIFLSNFDTFFDTFVRQK